MKGQVLHASVAKVVCSNIATVHSLGATGVLRPAYRLRAKLTPLMAALPLRHPYFSVYGQRQTCDFNQHFFKILCYCTDCWNTCNCVVAWHSNYDSKCHNGTWRKNGPISLFYRWYQCGRSCPFLKTGEVTQKALAVDLSPLMGGSLFLWITGIYCAPYHIPAGCKAKPD